jgi:dihydrofolate reductase
LPREGLTAYAHGMMLSLIVAAAENGVIGRGGVMPWTMPSDLKYLRRKTLGKPVIMGRKTFAAIGKPLPKRHNIVISRDRALVLDGCEVVASLADAITRAENAARAAGVDEVMVLGGGEIYAQALPLAGRVYLTRIHAHLDGDATFPALDAAQWSVVEQGPLPRDPKDEFAAETLVYERRVATGDGSGLEGRK